MKLVYFSERKERRRGEEGRRKKEKGERRK